MAKKTLNQKTGPQVLISGSPQEKEYLDKLSQDILNANEEFVDFIARQQSCSHTIRNKTESINAQYNQRLFTMMVMPLRQGVDKQSLLQAVGFAAGALLMSPDFRKTCAASVQNIMYPYVEQKANKAGPDSFWGKKKQQMDIAAKGGRLPLTPESSAVICLGFCRNAHDKMRVEGSDVDRIRSDFKQATHSLQIMMHEDGIREVDFEKSVRTIAGQLIEKDPKLANCFAELAFDEVTRSQGELMESGELWRGEYKGANGKPFRGVFTPRPPIDEDGYAHVLAKFYKEEFKDCKEPDDVLNKFKDPEHLNKYHRYIGLMQSDKLLDRNISKCLQKFAIDGVNTWCGDHGYIVKDGKIYKDTGNTKAGKSSSGNKNDHYKPGGYKKNQGGKDPCKGKPKDPENFRKGPMPKPRPTGQEFGAPPPFNEEHDFNLDIEVEDDGYGYA